MEVRTYGRYPRCGIDSMAGREVYVMVLWCICWMGSVHLLFARCDVLLPVTCRCPATSACPLQPARLCYTASMATESSCPTHGGRRQSMLDRSQFGLLQELKRRPPSAT